MPGLRGLAWTRAQWAQSRRAARTARAPVWSRQRALRGRAVLLVSLRAPRQAAPRRSSSGPLGLALKQTLH